MKAFLAMSRLEPLAQQTPLLDPDEVFDVGAGVGAGAGGGAGVGAGAGVGVRVGDGGGVLPP